MLERFQTMQSLVRLAQPARLVHQSGLASMLSGGSHLVQSLQQGQPESPSRVRPRVQGLHTCCTFFVITAAPEAYVRGPEQI